jgi:acyl dehydratase
MKEEVMGRYFEDYEEGETIVTPARTVTETDIVNFAGIAGDWDQLHTNEEYASNQLFGERIAHGLLVLAIWSGLVHRKQILHGTSLGFLDLEVDFRAPTRIGDTLRCEMTVAKKSETSNDDRGVITFDTDIVDQNDEIVLNLQNSMMIMRRGDGA